MDEKTSAAIVYSDIIPFGNVPEKFLHLPRREKLNPLILFQRNFIYSKSCVMVRRKFLDTYRITFDPECVPWNDWFFYCQRVVRGKIYSLGYPLIKYRIHSNNLSCDQIKMYQAGIRAALKHLRMLDEVVTTIIAALGLLSG